MVKAIILKRLAALLFSVTLLLAACAPASPTATPSPGITATPSPGVTGTPSPGITETPPAVSKIKHVFLVVMENHGYDDIWGSGDAPYINSLGNQFARATNYHALTHPSLPNYLQLFGGSNGSITTDCIPSDSCHVSARHLGDGLEDKGLTWKAYAESMPAPCALHGSGDYAPRHNPPVYFDDLRNDPSRCASLDVPYSALASDLGTAAATPNFALVVPNLCNDMHSCPVATGDAWLKANLPPILDSPACTSDLCLLILTWDEDDGTSGNHVLTIFAGSAAKTGGVASSASYTHYSLLRTVESIFGLPALTANDASASPMLDLLK